MSSRVIADSDNESDEGERFSPPHRRPRPPSRPTVQPAPDAAAAAAVAHSAPTKSSDQESPATVSTDSAYFQRIYNDQHEAARERTRGSRAGESGEGREGSHRSSLVTIPEASELMTVRNSHGSSMTSTTEPNDERYGDMFSDGQGPDDTGETDVLVEGADRLRQEGSADDLWDVQSDSEAPRTRTASSRRHLAAVRSKLDGAGQDHAMANDSIIFDGTETLINDQDDAERKGQKRKRLQRQKQAVSLTSASGAACLNRSLESVEDSAREQGEEKATAFSIPVPGLPLQRDAPLDTPRQKKSVTIPDSTEDPSLTSTVKKRSLLPQQQTLYAAGSSGSRTSINSPRNCSVSISSDGFESLPIPITVEKVTIRRAREYGSLGMGIQSSPDVIAAEAPEESMSWAPGPEEHSDGEPAVVQTERALSEVRQHGDAAETEQRQEVIEERAPRRRRGRPKKNSDVHKRDLDQAADPDLEVEAVPHEAPKRKRGRPKKQPERRSRDQAEADAEAPFPEVDASNIPILEGQDGIASPDAGNSSQGTDAIRETKRRRQESAGTEKHLEVLKPTNEPVEEDAATTGRVGAKTVSTTTTASTASTASKASSTTKPAYRVGLSKRSKIAPLLKMVRKS